MSQAPKSSQPVGLGRARESLSSTCPSGTPPTAQNSFKVLALLLSQVACPPQQLGSQPPGCSSCAQYPATLISRAPYLRACVPEAAVQSWVQRSWAPAHPAPFLFTPSVGWWGGGGTWGPLDRGVATLSFSVRSSSLDMGGLFCNLQVVFWFSSICCIFMFHTFWGDFCLAFIHHHLF